jgi:hypothetical protein
MTRDTPVPDEVESWSLGFGTAGGIVHRR